jgi:RHS repeat-associated protein
MIMEPGGPVATDRLGSVRSGIAYYPWGEEMTSTANGTLKFGTYFRDAVGQDYADQRYYNSNAGRFYTADRGRGVNLWNPISWNKYAFAGDDPVNKNDPTGRCAVMISGIVMGPGSNASWSTQATSLGADTAYPYSGQGTFTGSAGVIGQAAGGPNAATLTAYSIILSAEASSSSPVDIVAYSGGAGAFAAAWKLLTSTQQADIGSIVYLAPGSAGATLPSDGDTSTWVGSGWDPRNLISGAFTAPVGTVNYTSCNHTDLGCLFGTAAAALANVAADGSCYPQISLTRQQVLASLAQASAAAQRQSVISSWQAVGNYVPDLGSGFLDWLDSIPVGGPGYAVDSSITYDF